MCARVGTDYDVRRWVISEVRTRRIRRINLGTTGVLESKSKSTWIHMYCTFNARDCIVEFRKEHVELSIVVISKGLIYKYINSRILTPVGDGERHLWPLTDQSTQSTSIHPYLTEKHFPANDFLNRDGGKE